MKILEDDIQEAQDLDQILAMLEAGMNPTMPELHREKSCLCDDCGMTAVIPPKRNRKEQRMYDKHLYKLRHLVENAFLHLKRWRGIATRYAKNSASFLATVQIRCIALWCAVLT